MPKLVVHNLSHAVMKLALPMCRNNISGLPTNHTSIIAVRENDRFMAFYNEANLDDDICIILEEAKTIKHPELGLAWRRLNGKMTNSQNVPNPKSIKLNNVIGKIKAKFLQTGLMCLKKDVNTAEISALSVDYQSAIKNACLEARNNHSNLDLEILFKEAQQMYEMQGNKIGD